MLFLEYIAGVAPRYPDVMKILFLLFAAAAVWGQETPPPADPVVLTVGSEKITKSQFEQILGGLSDQQRTQAQTPQGKRQIAERLAELKVLAQAAREQKLDQDPKIQSQLKLQSDQVLANVLFQQLGNKAKPDEAAVRAFYAVHKQDWEEIKARHILIRMQGSQVPAKPNQKDLTDAEALAKAQEIRAKIVAGADFATEAKAESDDTGTGQNGGELGSFAKGRMVPAFEQAAFALEVGKVSEPVKTPFGYHLILVESHTTKTFDEVRQEIEAKMKPEQAKKGLEELKEKTPTVFNESYFGK